jgi:hypothetical protein
MRHSWQSTGNQERTCGNCGTVAIRRGVPCGMPKAIEYHRNGQRIIAERVPPCGDWDIKPRDPHVLAALADEADRAAWDAYHAGDFERAARLIADCRVLDPSRAGLWSSRTARIGEGARKSSPDKAVALTERIELAGRQYPEELERWAAHNRRVYERAEPEL